MPRRWQGQGERRSDGTPGVTVVLQAVQGPTGAPLGFDLSNGVLLTLGY